MGRKSNKKFLEDGVTPNPSYRPGKSNKKFLEDGVTPNPTYRSKTNTKLLSDGSVNPRYTKGVHTARTDFVAWDSEGLDLQDNDPFSHAATLLMNSHGDYVENENGLSTLDWLHFLTEGAKKYPRAIHIMFSFGYDVNMAVRDIPRCGYGRDSEGNRTINKPFSSLEGLQAGNAVRYGCYELQYRQHKSLTIRKYDPNNKYKPVFERNKVTGKSEAVMVTGPDGITRQKMVINWQLSMVIYDTFGFFQASFVKALESYMGKDYKGLAFIESMKKKRSMFTHADKEEIREYCKQECIMLVDLLNNLRDCFEKAGLHLTRWDGAGAAAAALLKTQGVKEHKAVTSQEVTSAAQYAYAGGRIETIQYGHIPLVYDENGIPIPQVWHYDIKSAYPYAMTHLPSLADGTWYHHVKRSVLTPNFVKKHSLFTLYRIEWDFKKEMPLYPFFFRNEVGSILFPKDGAGWVWGPELQAALDHSSHDDIKILEAYTFQPSTKAKPFAFLPELFTQRAIWKREGNGAEKALKLAINSLYGKLAQRIGYTPRGSDKVEPPPYHQIEWAGFITSYTRATLYRAAMRNPQAIIAIATDGIFSTQNLELEEGEELGAWEKEIHPGMTQVTSGVYWLDNYEKDKKTGEYMRDESGRVKTVEIMYCRGFDKESIEREEEMKKKGKPYAPITRARVLSAWDTLITHECTCNPNKEDKEHDDICPFHKMSKNTVLNTHYGHSLDCSARRFVTIGSSLSGDEQFKYWHTWKDMIRVLSLDALGTKREDILAKGIAAKVDGTWGKIPPSQRLVKTRARTNYYYNMWVDDEHGQKVRRQAISLKHPLPWDHADTIAEETLDDANAQIVEQEIEDSWH